MSAPLILFLYYKYKVPKAFNYVNQKLMDIRLKKFPQTLKAVCFIDCSARLIPKFCATCCHCFTEFST